MTEAIIRKQTLIMEFDHVFFQKARGVWWGENPPPACRRHTEQRLVSAAIQ